MTRYESITSHDADLYPGKRYDAPAVADTHMVRSPANIRQVPDVAAAEPELTSQGGRRRLSLIELWEKVAEICSAE